MNSVEQSQFGGVFGGVVEILEKCAIESKRFVVRPSGFEPPTFCSGGKRSIQLSYGRTCTLIVSYLAAAHSAPRVKLSAKTALFMASGSWPNAVTKTRPLP